MKLILKIVTCLILSSNLTAQNFIVKNCQNQTFLVDSNNTVTYGPAKKIKQLPSSKLYIITDSTNHVKLFDYNLHLVNSQTWNSIKLISGKSKSFFLVSAKDTLTEKSMFYIMNINGMVDTTINIILIEKYPEWDNELEVQLKNRKYYSYDGIKMTEISGFSPLDKWAGVYGNADSRRGFGFSYNVKLPEKITEKGYEITNSLDQNNNSTLYGMKFKGKVILENEYNNIEYLENSSSQSLFIVQIGSKFGLVNNQGIEILPLQFYSITTSYDKNMIAIVKKCYRSQSYLILNSEGIFKHINVP